MLLTVPLPDKSLKKYKVLYNKKLKSKLNTLSWQLHFVGSWRVISRRSVKGKFETIHLGRFIWELCKGKIPKNMVIDHKNRNPLDNRLSNLRLASITENNRNLSKRRKSTSKYKGVYWSPEKQRWRATIRINGKKVYLGDFKFEDELKAAKAYNVAAKKHFGKFSCLNTL